MVRITEQMVQTIIGNFQKELNKELGSGIGLITGIHEVILVERFQVRN